MQVMLKKFGEAHGLTAAEVEEAKAAGGAGSTKRKADADVGGGSRASSAKSSPKKAKASPKTSKAELARVKDEAKEEA